jgi:cobyrinic acid a,c-diamide synthase
MVKSEFIIAATSSGSGKTLLTLGILAALARRGLKVQPFKCGPDFIDPSLHKMITGRTSYNLDLFMMGEEACRNTYDRFSFQADTAVIEGVMGLFDGGASSTAALSLALALPVVLIVDVRSAAESVAAIIKGFELFNPAVRICGVICNQVGSERHKQLIRDAVATSCSSGILGFFPRHKQFSMPSRHLGLHMGDEIAFSDVQMIELAETIEESIDIDRLLSLSEKTVADCVFPIADPKCNSCDLRLAVARDNAFCFYYQENLDLFTSHGIEIVSFSPLTDARPPTGIDGIYLGGGYPELYGAQLSRNVEMRRAILDYVNAGGAVYAECGGFMYLTYQLIDLSGDVFPMAGVFPLVVKMKPKLARLGYRKVKLQQDCLLGRAGQILYGHEFHYSEVVAVKEKMEPLYELEDGRQEGFVRNRALGSYVHLHLGGTVDNIRHFAETLRSARNEEKI